MLRELGILVNAKGAGKAAGEIKKVDSAIGRIGQHAKKGLASAGNNLKTIGAMAAGAAATGLAASVKLAADFESQLNIINTVAHETPAGITAIGDSIRALARTTGTSTEDLTAAYYDLVSAGIKTADAQNVLVQANKLAIGGLATTAETVDLLTTAINAYGGDASKAAEYANSFAEAIAAGKVTAAELAGSFAQVGPLAAQAGISVNEISAAIGVMTATGTGAAEAFTQIRSATIALQKPTASMRKLQKDLGVNFAKMADKKGLAFTYNEIAKAAEDAGIPMIKLTGRVEGALFAAQVAGDNYGKYAAELDKVNRSSDGAGVAQAQMAERTKGAAFQFGVLKAGLRDIGITIGSAVLPKLTPLISKLNEFLAKPETTASIARLAEDVAAAFEKVPWGTVGTSMRMAGTGAKAIFDAFMGMPSWVQSAVLTGWGLNKLTGGALGGIIGELGKGLIKGVLGMTAGVVNAKAGVVNVAGVAGAGAAPGAPGGGGIANAIGSGAALAVVIEGVREGVNLFGNLGGVLEAGKTGDSTAVLTNLKQAMDQTILVPQILRDIGNGIIAQIEGSLPKTPIPVVPQGMSPDERQAVNDQRAKTEKAMSKTDRLRERIEANRIATVTKGNGIISAIRGLRMNVNLTIPVTLNASQKRSVLRVKAGSNLYNGVSYDRGVGQLE